jgi:hypothetical protein
MKETPNKDDPQADVVFIVEELLNLFNEAEGGDDPMQLNSSVGSKFHARVLNAARHLGVLDHGR